MAINQEQDDQLNQDEEQPKGIIDSAIEPYEPAAPVTEPVTDIRPETDTVEARLSRLTAQDSPYMKVARQGAVRTAGRRGLINTSIAAGAGEEAAIKAALPIAQQDAAAYTTERLARTQSGLAMGRDVQSAELNRMAAEFQSGLTMDEIAAKSGFTIDEMAARSGLTREEMESQATLNMQRDTHSAGLNENLAVLQNTLAIEKEADAIGLRVEADKVLQDQRFSDEVKIQYVNTVNSIIRESQNRINSIGLSDRTAAQQAEAIRIEGENRNAQLAVYSNLLNSFNDWNWGTEFAAAV